MKKIIILTMIVLGMIIINLSFSYAFETHGKKNAPDSLKGNSPYIIKSDRNGEYHCRRNGTPLYKNRFRKVGDFHEGVFWAQDKETGKFFHADSTGNAVYKQRYVKTYDFVNGYAVVRDDIGEFHIKLKSWKALYSRRFYKARDFYEGLAAVSNEDEDWFFADSTGTLLKKKYASVGDFQKNETAWVEDLNTGKFFHIDKTEKPIYDNQYDEVTDFVNDTATTKDGKIKVLLIMQKDKKIEKHVVSKK